MARIAALSLILLASCGPTLAANGGSEDQCGCPPGPQGPQGPRGEPGPPGAPGGDGAWRSGSRLTLLTIKGEDGSEMPWGGFWDEELRVACHPWEIDGEMRCVPSGSGWEELFEPEDLVLFSR